MRLQRSVRLEREWYTLSSEIRGFIEGLKRNPRPEGARTDPERPDRYEEFIDNRWIGWRVKSDGSETVIQVTIE